MPIPRELWVVSSKEILAMVRIRCMFFSEFGIRTIPGTTLNQDYPSEKRIQFPLSVSREHILVDSWLHVGEELRKPAGQELPQTRRPRLSQRTAGHGRL